MVARRVVRGAQAMWLVGVLVVAGCELTPVEIPGGERLVVVVAVMRPDVPYQYVIVEQTLDGVAEARDSMEFPVPPHGPDYPITGATVAVTNLDLASDPCGSPVTFERDPYDSTAIGRPGLYWAPAGCPTMRPGDRLALRVEVPTGEVVTGVTRVPGMREAYLARGADSVRLGGGDSVLTFNRDRDTLRFGVDAVVGRLLQLDVRRWGDLTDYGTKVQADTTAFTLAGDAVNVFVSGRGNDVFRGGRSYVLTLTLSDTNYFDFSRSANNEFTGRGYLNRLTGGLGVFGSAVAVTSRVWVVADFDDPREGVFDIRGTIPANSGPVTIDLQLSLYLSRPEEQTEVSALLEGDWFTWGTPTNPALPDLPPLDPKRVVGKSVDGSYVAERLYLVIPDTLADGNVTLTTLDAFATAGDSFPVLISDSIITQAVPIHTLIAVRRREP